MTFMRYLFIAIITFVIITGYNSTLFSWGLFSLFSDSTYSRNTLDKIKNFNPDTDIFYLPEVKGKNLFESINDFSIFRRDDVRKYIYIYLTHGRNYTKRAIRQSYKYSDQINKIFEQNKDIPKEIALLPLLESAFNPHAVSRSNAVGVWQFMKNTSTPLGLRNDKWIDERRDIEKSTNAAIRHLRGLYLQFHSWELALMAYNGGAGYLKKVISSTKAQSVWDLVESDELRKETKEYLPRFVALLMIYKHQKMFGIEDEITIETLPEHDTFTLLYPVHIKQVSKITKVPVEHIRALNPELKQNVTPPYLRNYELLVPKNAVEVLESNKNKLKQYKYKRLRRYVIKKGDSITVIARRYNKSPGTIMRLNNIQKPRFIKPGQVIYIPN